MNSKVLTLGLMILTGPPAFAASGNLCFQAYVQAARDEHPVGTAFHGLGTGMSLAGSAGSSSSFVNPTLGTVAVFGGSTLKDFGDGKLARAQFARNVGQSISEGQASVAGPYTVRLTNDLNDAIYATGLFTPRTGSGESQISPLDGTTRVNLEQRLHGARISAEQLGRAHRLMLASGALCTLDGNILDQVEWAEQVVSHVVGLNRPAF